MINANCVVVGGGPAGMMLGLLLARAGVKTIVIEKHADFLRDFRGDTIHPSTLEVIHELGLLDAFLQRPHQQMPKLRAWVGDQQVDVADFSHLPVRCPFIAFMPQWDFLDFLAVEARRHPGFQLIMQAEATGLIEDRGRVVGIRVQTSKGMLELRANLIVAADGRSSLLRREAGLVVHEFGAPIDVLWFRVSRQQQDPVASFGRFDQGRVMVMLNRNDYWQLGYVIPKGGADQLRRQGVETMRTQIAKATPFLSDRVNEIRSWDDLKLLTVKVDRLRQWFKPGLLCIGDAAHAMSPVGGVGINLAIQDAVATANLLAGALRRGQPTERDLERVQQRRLWPTKVTQRLQLIVQESILGAALRPEGFTTLPLPLRLLRRFPFLTRIPARLIGLGFRPEHVRI